MILPKLQSPQDWLHAGPLLTSWPLPLGSYMAGGGEEKGEGGRPRWGLGGRVSSPVAPWTGFPGSRARIPQACAHVLGFPLGSGSGPWGDS